MHKQAILENFRRLVGLDVSIEEKISTISGSKISPENQIKKKELKGESKDWSCRSNVKTIVRSGDTWEHLPLVEHENVFLRRENHLLRSELEREKRESSQLRTEVVKLRTEMSGLRGKAVQLFESMPSAPISSVTRIGKIEVE